ncbi:MAG TPA: hypothetical protein VIE43_20620 [Thermoanaerobaculia bacterium]|jgi:hypothetical protein|nr:hypothetical protein [Thermoanaerobaculia bacterium]
MRLSTLGCLRRGWTNLSANWELVLLQWLQAFGMLALSAFGALLALLILGVNLASLGRGSWLRALGDLSPALLLALAALTAVWLASLLVYCFFQAGTYGVLAAADRQALPGARRQREFFRTFTLRDFRGWGGRYVWRYFGVALLFGILLLALSGVALLWLGFAAAGNGEWGSPAALAIVLGGVLPVGFLALVAGLGFHLAQADLAREGSGVRSAWRRGLGILGRRLGAVTALFVLIAAALLALAALFLPLSTAADALLAGAPGVRALVRFLLVLLASLPDNLLVTLFAGALVALVRSESLPEIRRNPEVQTA